MTPHTNLLLAIIILVPFGLFGLGYLLYRVWYSYRLAKSGIAEIDTMTGKEFEDYLKILFERLGYTAKVTPYCGDYGADLVIEKAGVRTAVQAKRYRWPVRIDAVQQVVAAKARYRCSRAMIVTNSYLTSPAWHLARDNQVAVWSRKRLIEKILQVQGQEAQRSSPRKYLQTV